MKKDILKFIKRLKKLFLLSEAVIFICAMTLFGFAAAGEHLLFIPFALCVVLFLAVLVLYLSKVKYSIVYEFDYAGDVLNVKVKGASYTYAPCDAVKMQYDDVKIVVFFQKEGSRERFVLLRRIPFDHFRTEQFRLQDVAPFFPGLTLPGDGKG